VEFVFEKIVKKEKKEKKEKSTLLLFN